MKMSKTKTLRRILTGGPGSGHHGHAGRPGKRGGSAPGKGTASGLEVEVKGQTGKWILIHNALPGEGYIVGDRTGDVEKAKSRALELSGILGSLPEEDVEGLNRIDAQAGGLWFSASYVSSSDEIWIMNDWWDKSSDEKARSLVHEIGHRVQNQNPKLYRSFPKSSVSHFKGLIAPEFQKGYKGKRKQRAEVFAESYQLYQLSPGSLEKGYPDLFDFWENRNRKSEGGPGSGHFGHAGRPGKRGGSAPGRRSLGSGLYIEDTFKSGKAMWLPRKGFIKNEEGVRSHTQICARIITEDPKSYKPEDVLRAKEIIDRNGEEWGPLERVVQERGYISVEVNFMGNVTLVAESGKRHPTVSEFNKLFQRTKKGIRRGDFDVVGAEQVAIHYDNSVWSGTFSEMEMISGFTLNQFGRPVPHIKEGGPGSGFFGHAGRPGLRGGSVSKSLNLSDVKVINSPEESLERTWGGGKAYWISSGGELVDVVGSSKDEEEVHGKVIKLLAKKNPEFKLDPDVLSESDFDHEDVMWAHYNLALKKDWVAISFGEVDVNVTTAEMNTKTFHKVQALMVEGKIPKGLNVYWGGKGGSLRGIPSEDFLRGNKIVFRKYKFGRTAPTIQDSKKLNLFDLKRVLTGGPGSGHFGHAGRPGLVGGSLPEGSVSVTAERPDPTFQAFGDMTFNEQQIVLDDAVRSMTLPEDYIDLNNASSVIANGFIDPNGELFEIQALHQSYALEALRRAGEDRVDEGDRALGEFLSHGYVRINSGPWMALEIVDPENLSPQTKDTVEFLVYIAALNEQNLSWEVGHTDGYPTSGGDRTTFFREIGVSEGTKLTLADLKRILTGGPGSGFFGHAGRPGFRGGSAPRGADKGFGGGGSIPEANYEGIQTRKKPENVQSRTYGEKAYILTEDEKILDVVSTEGEWGTHVGLAKKLVSQNQDHPDYKLMAEEQKIIDDPFSKESTIELINYEKMLNAGGMAVRFNKDELSIQSATVDDYYLGVVQEQISKGNIPIRPQTYWGGNFRTAGGDPFYLETGPFPTAELLLKSRVKLTGGGDPIRIELKDATRLERLLMALRMRREGGPGSGFFGHRGRPGLRGGSLSKGALDLRGMDVKQSFSEIDEVYARHEELDDWRGYWISPEGDLLPVEGNGGVHGEVIRNVADRNPSLDINTDFIDFPEGSDPEQQEDLIDSAFLDKAQWLGWIPVNVTSEEVNVRTEKMDKKTFYLLQDHLVTGKLPHRDNFVWGSRLTPNSYVPGVMENLSTMEFLQGDKLSYDKKGIGWTRVSVREGGPGSGHFGHAGRPGKRGGSAPGKSQRVWQGERQESSGEGLSKIEVGRRGEQLASKALSEKYGEEFIALNEGINNAPLDLGGDHQAVEVKTGSVTNTSNALQWRSTIGQPGKTEAKLLNSMSPSEKRVHNRYKQQQILQRKHDLVSKMSELAGEEVEPLTIGIILSEDGNRGDVYEIPGFHSRLGWKDHAVDKYYVGTYDYSN